MFVWMTYQEEIISFGNTVTVGTLPRMRKVLGSGLQMITAITNNTNVNTLDVSKPIDLQF